MKRKWFVSVLILVLLAMNGVVAAAQSDNAQQPEAISDGTSQSGTLTGSRAGNFAYYALQYPGDERVVNIRMEFAPGDPATSTGVGFNVYGPNGFLIGPMLSTDPGVLRLEYSDDNPATWLIQVYNYVPDQTVTYTLTTTGLSDTQEQPGATATSPEQTAETTPQQVQSLGNSASGTLVGSSGGTYTYYTLDYPGNDQDVLVRMTYVPADSVTVEGMGFVVYGPGNRTINSEPSGTPGERTATISASEPGQYLIQVYNYIDGVSMNYTLTR